MSTTNPIQPYNSTNTGHVNGDGTSLTGPRRSRLSTAEPEPQDGAGEYDGREHLDEDVQDDLEAEQEDGIGSSPRIKRRTKAHVNIASLNMKGFGVAETLHPNNKWNRLNIYIRTAKINIFALQETHLSAERASTIRNLYGKRMEIFFSSDTASPNSKGVAFVINKDITNITNIVATEIVPGRALLVTIPWHLDLTISILNVYAPNAAGENTAFWYRILQYWRHHRLQRPDFLMGDFNIVEDAHDRLPNRRDNANAVAALTELKLYFRVTDGWRATYPESKEYTWTEKRRRTMSRLDRIYTQCDVLKECSEWRIEKAPLPTTDHSLIRVRLDAKNTPFIGPGRWAMPTYILADDKFRAESKKRIEQLALDLHAVQDGRTNQHNPQVIFETFKKDIVKIARDRAKALTPKTVQLLEKMRNALQSLQQQPRNSGADVRKDIDEMHLLKDKIGEIEDNMFTRMQASTTANYRCRGEQTGCYWPRVALQRGPKDLVYSLLIPDSNPERCETRSDKMAQLARDYHENLQRVDLDVDLENRPDAINEALSALPEPSQQTDMRPLITNLDDGDIRAALKTAEASKAPGLNGLPYEFWAAFDTKRASKSTVNTAVNVNIIASLRIVFNDIEEHGVDVNTHFTEGWLCPLYKKGDRKNVANYRPITLLNSDYKIMTKALSMKLAHIANSLIHKNQAGFLPGRRIIDETKLAQLMTRYAEATEENGIIVALDQEKAYDKITHDYLWQVLDRFGLPAKFTRLVSALYTNAQTVVIINGERISPFRVTRGVRQGDPLSCLLFILAIEPLAAMIRHSDLQGFTIPGTEERLVTNLFADDTSAYLSDTDDLSKLTSILQRWCLASRARFNIPKTFILPIGTPTYRRRVVGTRRHTNSAETIPADINIVADGDSFRLLGAWIGNKSDQHAIWSTTIEKIDHALRPWRARGLTMKGKSLVVQMIVGGMTQYLTCVQGMPKDVEQQLSMTIRKFIWGQKAKHPPIGMDTLCRPWNEGGINLLNLSARNHAINMMWMKTYLTSVQDRPDWTFIASILARKAAPKRIRHDNAKIHPLLQSWKAKTQRGTPLPGCLVAMLKTGIKYGVHFQAARLPKKLKNKLPAWYHISNPPALNKLNNLRSSKCLRMNHKASSIGDLMKISKRMRKNDAGAHHDHASCPCRPCKKDRLRRGCKNPARCCMRAVSIINSLEPKWNPLKKSPKDNLSLTKSRKDNNVTTTKEHGRITFNPSLRTDDDIHRNFRAFSAPATSTTLPARRSRLGISIQGEETEVFIAACPPSHPDDAGTAGLGVWIRAGDYRNKSARLPFPYSRSTEGELAALILATILVPDFAPLHIVSASPSLIHNLTSNLNDREELGWIGTPHPELYAAAAYRLRSRSAPATLRLQTKPESEVGLKEAKNLALLGVKLDHHIEIPTEIPPPFRTNGARLTRLSQALAYKGIMTHKSPPERKSTRVNLEIIKYALYNRMECLFTDEQIWSGTKDPAISRPITQFLWKGIHEALSCGPYWDKVTHFEHRALCTVCGSLETLEHIMTECDGSGQAVVWKLATFVWEMRQEKWVELTIGAILGCGSLKIRDDKGRISSGKTRLLKILISESAYLIWKLRNRRIFDPTGEDVIPSAKEVMNKWFYAINLRLKIDCMLTHKKFLDKAIPRELILKTWSGTLENDKELPVDWISTKEVLVGRPEIRNIIGVG